jgi:hypothetical protein
MVNMPEPDICDNPDRLDPNLNLSRRAQGIFSQYGEQDFEERLAIAEYEGEQMPLHAHCIAYLDAFISILTALPATASQRIGWI